MRRTCGRNARNLTKPGYTRHMGFRFRRSIRLAPGLRLNLSRSGISTSFGGRGLTLNFGEKGARATVGLPGTGLSYSTRSRARATRSSTAATSHRVRNGLLLLLVGSILAAMVFGTTRSSSPPQARPTSAPTVKRAIATAALACRGAPNIHATKLRMLSKAEAVVLLDAQAGWSRVDTGKGVCWSASRFLVPAS